MKTNFLSLFLGCYIEINYIYKCKLMLCFCYFIKTLDKTINSLG